MEQENEAADGTVEKAEGFAEVFRVGCSRQMYAACLLIQKSASGRSAQLQIVLC